MTPLSVVICCANVADTLEAACQSVAWADELIIVDSGSTDHTAEIATHHADRYVQEPWRGHTGQKQFAVSLARNDWIFILDGDERCTPSLTDELRSMDTAMFARFDMLLVPRRNYIMGRKVTAWWPDRLTRIFHRGRCTWDGHVLHDTRTPTDPQRVHTLKHPIEHKRHSSADFTDYFSGARMDSRLLDVADQMHTAGKRCHWWDLVFRPQFAFWKFFLFKRGFRDGTFGLLIAQKAAVSVQLKYATLWSMERVPVGEDDDRARPPVDPHPPSA